MEKHESFCTGCIKAIKEGCDILGKNPDKQACITSGYREERPLKNKSIRIYNNTRGAYWTTKDTDGRMS